MQILIGAGCALLSMLCGYGLVFAYCTVVQGDEVRDDDVNAGVV